jgi:hypothetical protein
VNGLPIILAALALGGQPQGERGVRIAQSATAAQALQGPLDGTWVLVDGAGRPRFALQIVDPAGWDEPLQAAWREADGDVLGAVSTVRRSRERLSLVFEVAGQQAQVRLRRSRGGIWRGNLRLSSAVTAVSLRHGAP